MIVKILSVSINPNDYNLEEIYDLSYDEAKMYFDNDYTRCCNVREFVVDQSKENEITFHADGILNDPSDTTLNWLKVVNK